MKKNLRCGSIEFHDDVTGLETRRGRDYYYGTTTASAAPSKKVLVSHIIKPSLFLLVPLLISIQTVVMSVVPKEWTIVYHGAAKTFKGRAEFLRLLFEDAGIDYDITGDNIRGPTGIMDCFRG